VADEEEVGWDVDREVATFGDWETRAGGREVVPRDIGLRLAGG